MRDGFLFRRSYFDAIKSLNAKQREHLFSAVCNYALDKIEPELTGIEQIAFDLIRPQLCADYQRYLNGLNGGAPRGNKNAKKTTENQPKNNQETTENQPKNNHWLNLGCFKERETEKDREKEAEKEKEQKKIEQEKEIEKEKEIEINNTPREREGDDFLSLSASEQTESRKRFFEAFDIQIDSYSARLGDMDFDRLYTAYLESSNYLQVTRQCLFLSWICKNYTRIIGGYYKDKPPKPQKKSNMDILRELYDEAVAEEENH